MLAGVASVIIIGTGELNPNKVKATHKIQALSGYIEILRLIEGMAQT